MTVNKAENSLERQLIKRIISLERAMRELKTAVQPIGADVLKVSSVPGPGQIFLTGPVTIAAGDFANLRITLSPGLSVPTLTNIQSSMFIDSYTTPNYWPTGSALTADQKVCEFIPIDDAASFDELTGLHYFVLRIKNLGASPHDFYISNRILIPAQSGAGLS